MNIDDVACATVLAATLVSIGIAAASFLASEVRRGEPVAHVCPRSHSIPSAPLPGAG
jgi:hypothetical protein